MPLRLDPAESNYAKFCIFRRYDWGRLTRFHMLDNRQYRARHGESCGDYGTGGVQAWGLTHRAGLQV